ncbi:uncharacterized protein [Asterias amurensis]|uniref:uncharacterized protein isoform X2 n=1 Tax=Asterias amurensis TaxID=7602 RepID=UPI003AB59488
MQVQSLEPLGLDVLRLPGALVDNCPKDFSFAWDNSSNIPVNFATIKADDLTMNVAASDQTSVKPDTEFNPFLSNDKVSYTSLALLMASQNDTDIIDGTEVSSCSSFSSPMSTTYSSEPPSPFSMDSSSIASSPMTDDTSHLCFDEDTLASLLEEDANNNDPGFFEEESKTKVQRTSFAHLSPSSVSNVSGSPVDGFDFGLAVSSPSFMCTNFVASTVKSNSPVTSERPDTSSSKQSSQRKSSKAATRKPPSLNLNFASCDDSVEVSILVQPEKHHRARYLTEGSRGSVKDETQQSFPTVKLSGLADKKDNVTLHVYVASDQGKIKPHGYYQACKVTGRNTTPCKEIDVDGTTVIEIPWETADKMEMSIDCVGILKLRNADVEQRIGLARSKRKSTTVRLVFRVFIEKQDGSMLTLQQISSPICCTQPLGHPEIVKKSLTSCSVKGEEELFIIGKNFIAKHTKVKLQELCPLGKVLWEGNCEIDRALFHNTHIVCRIPPYKSQDIDRPKEVYLVVSSGPNKASELYAHPINYMPSSETERKPDSISAHSLLSNTNVPSILESREAVLSTMEKIPSKPQEVTPPCKMERQQTSFADTLRAAAQLELNHPGLLAKLALHEPNASTVLVSSLLSL